ncbi:hypothetical protein QBE52_07055 [Clostridiaceae bacterium 35-E11]
MVVGVKYCGGCNPRYDRTKFLKRLIDALGRDYTFETVQFQKTYDILLILGGCHNCCANYADIGTKQGAIRAIAEKDFEKVFGRLQREFPNDNK